MIELYHIDELNIFFLHCVQNQSWQTFSLVAVPGQQKPILYAEEAAVGNVTVHFGEVIPLTRNQIKQRIMQCYWLGLSISSLYCACLHFVGWCWVPMQLQYLYVRNLFPWKIVQKRLQEGIGKVAKTKINKFL